MQTPLPSCRFLYARTTTKGTPNSNTPSSAFLCMTFQQDPCAGLGAQIETPWGFGFRGSGCASRVTVARFIYELLPGYTRPWSVCSGFYVGLRNSHSCFLGFASYGVTALEPQYNDLVLFSTCRRGPESLAQAGFRM